MLHIDATPALAKILSPSLGITDQEVMGLRTSMKRFINEWKEETERGMHAWTSDPHNAMVIDNTKELAERIQKERIQTVVWVGIGGSGLGPKVIQEVFETPQTLEFVLVDTIDPAVLQMTAAIVDWRQTLLVVASKSGETLETMSAFFYFYEALKQARGAKAASRVIAVTDPQQGYLRDLSLQEGFEIFPIPRDVGGRFSIFTPVGLLPMALLGGDVDAFVQGAIDMQELCGNEVLEENPAALLAGMQFLLDTKKGYIIRVIMPYSARLQSLARWNQQLIAESLGKNEVQNPFPLAAIGTQDQHSLLQQWMSGPRRCWHLIIHEIEKPRVFLPTELDEQWKHIAGKGFGQLLDALEEGTSQGLTAAKRPVMTASITRLDEYHLGQLFTLFLTEIVFLGKLYRIPIYGQPGVELSKQIAGNILMQGRMD